MWTSKQAAVIEACNGAGTLKCKYGPLPTMELHIRDGQVVYVVVTHRANAKAAQLDEVVAESHPRCPRLASLEIN